MKSINESYLSKTKLGGGALCEHSHALNLVQYFVKHKNVQILNKQFKFNKYKKNYHDLSFGAQLKLIKQCVNSTKFCNTSWKNSYNFYK